MPLRDGVDRMVGRAGLHHPLRRRHLRLAFGLAALCRAAPIPVGQQDAGGRMHEELDVGRLAQRHAVAARPPPRTHQHLAAVHHRIAHDEVVDVQEDVRLHRAAPVDAPAELAPHLVPRPVHLLVQPAPERLEVLVEPLRVVVATLHAEMRTALPAVSKCAPVALHATSAARAFHDDLVHVFAHRQPSRPRLRAAFCSATFCARRSARCVRRWRPAF